MGVLRHSAAWLRSVAGLVSLLIGTSIGAVTIAFINLGWGSAVSIVLLILLVAFMEGAYRQAQEGAGAISGSELPSISQQGVHIGEGARFVGDIGKIQQSVTRDPADPNHIVMWGRLDGLRGTVGPSAEASDSASSQDES
jgi:hypothetical protein